MLGIYYAGAIAFAAIVVQPKQEDIGKQLGVCNPGIGIAIFAVLAIVVLAPFAEEIFFRGFFFAGLRTALVALALGAPLGRGLRPGPRTDRTDGGDSPRRPGGRARLALQQDRLDLTRACAPTS